MKFNYLIHQWGNLSRENVSYLHEVTQRPRLSPDPRQEHWPLHHRPRAALGQGICSRKTVCNQAHKRKLTPQALLFQVMEFSFAVHVYWESRWGSEWTQGRKTNAWSPEHNEQNLKLWKKTILPKGKSRIHPSLLSHGGSLWMRRSYSATWGERNGSLRGGIENRWMVEKTKQISES